MKCNCLNAALLGATLLGCSGFAYAEDVMPKIQVGDHWTYQDTDDIAGTPRAKLTMTVTESADKNFTVRVSGPNGGSGYLIVFDSDLNALEQGPTKFTPNDGRGAPHDAKAGSTWKTNYTWKDTVKGGGGKGQAEGKCMSNEQMTTPAGTFDTLKCYVAIKVKPPGGGPTVAESDITTWFAPKTLRWAKRSFVMKMNGHVSESYSHELVEYELK